ncbi:hypothetical protein [Adlercreutzia murintestinalis]|jgi:DNA-damage-inducible protein J|uniref:hypothetical protein n=1 Tax=Adlercreutzia murintestinalis TaxID=2941325 RepID=UPI00203D2F0C|nr:hypothetical protein [Adlercreutzia murintestinalis]
MSKMVSARVSDALYERGSAQLEALGATVSELITSAFEYVLKEQTLPCAASGANAVDANARTLSKEKADFLKGFLHDCTLNVSIPADVSYDKQAICAARESRHETAA